MNEKGAGARHSVLVCVVSCFEWVAGAEGTLKDGKGSPTFFVQPQIQPHLQFLSLYYDHENIFTRKNAAFYNINASSSHLHNAIIHSPSHLQALQYPY